MVSNATITPKLSAATTTPLLTARNIEKHFDGVYALRQAHLEVAPGEVHVLMGENGAGKSTLAKIIAGVTLPDAGEITFDGQPVRPGSPMDAQQLGIGIVFQELDLFPSLTVTENIVIGQGGSKGRLQRGGLVNFAAMEAFCRPFLDRVGFTHSPSRLLGELSVGQIQLVAIARALSMNARLILMDEPTSALGDEDVARLFDLIRSLTARGVSIVYVSHKMAEIFQIADRITVMRDGATIGTLQARETNVNQIINMMVGRELAEATPRPSSRTDRQLLKVTSLMTGRVRNISFECAAGEVLGIAGLVGAGRSELGAALMGLDPIVSGSITIDGAPYRPRNVRDAINAGFGLVPEDRKGQGLMMQMSVRENCTVSSLSRVSTGGFIQGESERTSARDVLTRTRIKTASYELPVSALSGGNQQKVLLGRWIQVDPKVLFLDDPTRGIDVAAKRDIYRIVAELASRGKAILFVSSELPELLLNCDRIMVMHGGEVTGFVDARSTTQEQIMSLATHSCSSGETA